MKRSLKIIDSIFRIVFILSFLLIGVWVLFLPSSYGSELGIVFNNPIGKSEVSAMGGVYVLSAILVVYYWFKKQSIQLYRVCSLLLGTLVFARLLAICKGDLNEKLIYILAFEILLLVWSIVAKNNKTKNNY